MTPVSENLRRIRDRIGGAAVRAGRDPETIRLIGVTKRVSVERIREAIDAGLRDLGENRVQEAESKFPDLDLGDVSTHLIGHLQSNKARKAVHLFSTIQTVDSADLARRLDSLAPGPLRVLIQMKLGDETSKSGVTGTAFEDTLAAVRAGTRLELAGLMGIPPYDDDPGQVRPYFRQLRDAADSLHLQEVSMGMSHDFEVAIEEGATMVRIGTALFGERQ
jgi:hypothetical protein